MPQAAKHELMSITYSPAAQEIEISTEYGNHEIVKTEKAKSSFNLCPVLAKVKEYENQGWSLKSVNMSPYVVMYTLEK